MRKLPGLLPWLWLSALVVVIDLWTKSLILDSFRLYERLEVLPFFNLTLAFNRGAAFSFLAAESGWQRWFFIAVALVVSVGILVWMAREPASQRLLGIALSLVLGGAVGNVQDRIVHGYVVDFLDFHWAGWHFPAFNVADSAITVGAIFLVLDMFYGAKRDDG